MGCVPKEEDVEDVEDVGQAGRVNSCPNHLPVTEWVFVLFASSQKLLFSKNKRKKRKEKRNVVHTPNPDHLSTLWPRFHICIPRLTTAQPIFITLTLAAFNPSALLSFKRQTKQTNKQKNKTKQTNRKTKQNKQRETKQTNKQKTKQTKKERKWGQESHNRALFLKVFFGASKP